MRRSSRLALPMRRPEDVIPYLGKPIHWKQGRSAKALADAWFHADGIPPAVERVLATTAYLAKAELLEAWLERETDLGDGRATPSQTDLLALVGLQDGLFVLGIEAKVDESFGPLVTEWLSDASEGKVQRLAALCRLLGIEPGNAGHLRYQLLHRTAAVVLEAKRFRTDCAALLIQSFCARSTGLGDCIAFFDAIGFAGFGAGHMVGARRFNGVDLWVGWASDEPAPEVLAATARAAVQA